MTPDFALPGFNVSAFASPALVLPAVAGVLTYAAHSTLLLVAAWLLVRCGRLRSHALREWLWKSAAVLPLVTTSLALLGGWPQPLAELTLGESTTLACSFLPRAERPGENAAAAPSAAVVPNDAAAPPETLHGAQPTSDSTDAEAAGDIAKRGADGRMLNDPPVAVSASEDAAEDGSAEHAAAADEPVFAAPATVSVEVASEKIAAAVPDSNRRQDGGSTVAESVPAASEAADLQSDAPRLSATPPPPFLPFDSIAAWMLRMTVAICGAILAGGAILCLLRYARLARHFVRAKTLDGGPARQALDRLCRRARLRRRVRLMACRRTRQPLALGIWRWTIVLPESLERHLSRRELEALLAHELAHLARGDVLWLWLGQALCTCLAFQPLNFLARRGWQDAAEFQCDDWALARGVAPLELARCLAEVAQWRIDRLSAQAGLTAGGNPSQVGKRIRRLAEGRTAPDRWNRRRSRIALAAVSLLLAALIAGWAPRAAWSLPAVADAVVATSADRPADETSNDATDVSPADIADATSAVAEAPESSAEDAITNATAEGPALMEMVDAMPADDLAAEWQQLNRELRELNGAIRRLAAALAENADDPQLAKAADQLRRRADELESRRIQLVLRAGEIPEKTP